MGQTNTPFYIEKANREIEPYQEEKIIQAVRKAAQHTNNTLSIEDEAHFTRKLRAYIEEHVPNPDVVLDVQEVHHLVLRLLKYVRPDISSKYNDYKNHKVKQAKQAVQLTEQLNKEQSFIHPDRNEAQIKEGIVKRIKDIIYKLKTKHHIDQPSAFVVLNILFEDIHYQNTTDVSRLLSVLKDDVGLQSLISWIMIELERPSYNV